MNEVIEMDKRSISSNVCLCDDVSREGENAGGEDASRKEI